MKKMKQLLTLLLILGLALGFRSFEQIGTKSVVIPFSDGKEGMVPSEETDAEIKAVPLEEVESFSDFEISTIVLTEEKEPASEKKQEQRTEVSSDTSEGHSFSAGNEKQEIKELVSSGQNSQKQEEPADAPVNEAEPEKNRDASENKAETPSVHVHEWVDETVWHEEVTHIEHHDAVTEERWVSVLVRINHYICNACRKEFTTQEEAYAHEDATYMAAIDANDMSLAHSGHSVISETVDQGYYETVVIREAYDETVIDSSAWEEHRLRCTVCGETK